MRTILSPQQRRVLDLAATGLSDTAIADETGTTLKGVQHSLNVVYQKMGIDNDPQWCRRVRAVVCWLGAGR